MPFYAVRNGRSTGIFTSWDEVSPLVTGFSGFQYRKFLVESDAINYMKEGPSFYDATLKSSGFDHSSIFHVALLPSETKDTVASALKRMNIATTFNLTKWDGWQDEQDLIFCDGAAKNNGAAGAVAGFGVYAPDGGVALSIAYKSVPPYIIGSARPTNQTCELLAILYALKVALFKVHAFEEEIETFIVTDSMFAIRAVKEWSSLWAKNGWKTSTGAPVVHQNIIVECMEQLSYIEMKTHKPVKFLHVRGHTGVFGNEVADALAKLACDRQAVPPRVRRHR